MQTTSKLKYATQYYSLILFMYFRSLKCQEEKDIMQVEVEKTYCHWFSVVNILKEKRPFLVVSINDQVSAYMLFGVFYSQKQLVVPAPNLRLK